MQSMKIKELKIDEDVRDTKGVFGNVKFVFCWIREISGILDFVDAYSIPFPGAKIHYFCIHETPADS